jgi:kynurenine formamidase
VSKPDAARRHPMERRNWGRWGERDERGAANLLTPERVLAAVGLVRRGEAITLAHPISRRTPIPSHRPAPAHFMHRDGGDYAQDGRSATRSRFSDDSVLLATHTGTHVDALAHVWYGDRIYNGFPQDTIGSGPGARHCGIDKLGPLVARGVLLDLAGDTALADDVRVGPEQLERCRARQGTELREGDVVLLRTGWWSAHAHEPGQRFSAEPGPDVDGACWLADRGAACVGSDNFAFEALPAGGEGGFPVHELLLRDCGIPIVEGLALDELAARGVDEFLLVLAPLAISGATASPLNPVAVI